GWRSPEKLRQLRAGSRRLMNHPADRARVCRVVTPPIAAWLLVWSALIAPALGQQPPPDAAWMADADLDVERSITDLGLGAVQGVVVRDGKVYAYGDVVQAKPRIGVIREYTQELEPTGRVVWLRRDSMPLLVHPTGLTWHDRWGTFLG